MTDPNCGKHHGKRFVDCADCAALPGLTHSTPMVLEIERNYEATIADLTREKRELLDCAQGNLEAANYLREAMDVAQDLALSVAAGRDPRPNLSALRAIAHILDNAPNRAKAPPDEELPF